MELPRDVIFHLEQFLDLESRHAMECVDRRFTCHRAWHPSLASFYTQRWYRALSNSGPLGMVARRLASVVGGAAFPPDGLDRFVTIERCVKERHGLPAVCYSLARLLLGGVTSFFINLLCCLLVCIPFLCMHHLSDSYWIEDNSVNMFQPKLRRGKILLYMLGSSLVGFLAYLAIYSPDHHRSAWSDWMWIVSSAVVLLFEIMLLQWADRRSNRPMRVVHLTQISVQCSLFLALLPDLPRWLAYAITSISLGIVSFSLSKKHNWRSRQLYFPCQCIALLVAIHAVFQLSVLGRVAALETAVRVLALTLAMMPPAESCLECSGPLFNPMYNPWPQDRYNPLFT